MTQPENTTTAKPAIFITTDFNEKAEAQYPLDRISLRDTIRDAAEWAMQSNYSIVVRDEPAISGMLKRMFAQGPGSTEGLFIEPQSASVSDILSKHHPKMAVVAGGFDRTAADFDALLKQRDIDVIPVPEAGGITAKLFAEHKDELTLPKECISDLGKPYSVALRSTLERCKLQRH